MKLPALPQKPAEFVGSALDDLSDFPASVKSVVGHAIYMAQVGGKHASVKPLTGGRAFRGAGVLEVVEDFDGDTFRAVYTVRFAGVVYVLHAFQKKSTSGISTPKHDIDVVKLRLQTAKRHYEENYLKKAI